MQGNYNQNHVSVTSKKKSDNDPLSDHILRY